MGRGLFAIVIACGLTTGVAGCDSSDCESLPVQQLRVHGVSYVLSSSAATFSSSDLGPVVGEISDGLPAAASRCESFTLHDGQGSLPEGTDVYSINGIDQSKAVAAKVGKEVMRFDAFSDAP